MTRVQILLTDEQDREIEKLARQLRTSKAQLVREGVDLLLHQKKPAATPEPLLDLIGQAGPSGRTDISRDHDKYLTAVERKRNR